MDTSSTDAQPPLEQADHSDRRILVTGATGYVGGRLIPALVDAGFTVRATSRSVDSLKRFDWFDDVEHAAADLNNYEDITKAVEDVDVLYYLVHSMGKAKDFEKEEAEIAENIARAAEAAGVRQIVYLSGLIPPDAELESLSKHMRSRERVARILLDSPVDTIVLRAATLIGSGSASFEIIRHLSDRLPIMVTPHWINNKIEPISIRDAIYYLAHCADLDQGYNRGYDIGGGRVYKFKQLLSLFGKQRGHRNRIYSLPFRLPLDTLSGAWIALVTPAPFGIAKPLAQSMAEDAVTHNDDINEIIPVPEGGLLDYPDSVKLALERRSEDNVATSWLDSWRKSDDNPAELLPSDPQWAGQTVYKDTRTKDVDAPAEKLWAVIEGIGGDHGWYSTSALWKIRGVLDRLVGGPGLGGRRNPNKLSKGDRIDWWRVEYIDAPNTLVLRAEMRLDGHAWLELEAEDNGDGTSVYHQTAHYVPATWLGHLYWWVIAPFHTFVFPVMAANIAAAAAATEKDK
ncbi:NAD-dependent dehydratase [Corynebacterium phocae]|uniref:NAD-dependent dehydratase n=1 Tax=Corynebacterium phocae TaxID=161895 RepID=A0A1L7D4L4_9CORY|nr:SDR family oxidoreductase [Corynebacterium phocae]APT93060.1 NAD-dependent dehydratase [Corynebacterium phocae]KAA8722360.1 SDR family oxidoreductase [Corynebacterium phocae]